MNFSGLRPLLLCTLLLLTPAGTVRAGTFFFTDTLDDIHNYNRHEFTLARDSTVTITLNWIGARGPTAMEIVPLGEGCSSTWDSWLVDDPANGATVVYPLAAGRYEVWIWRDGSGVYTVSGIYTEDATPNDPEFSCSLDISQEIPGSFLDVSGHLGYGGGYFASNAYPDKFCNANYITACDLDLNDVFRFQGDGSSGNMMTVFLGGRLKPDFIEIYGSRRQLIDVLPSPADGITYGPFTLDSGDNYIHVYIQAYSPYEDYGNHGSYRVVIHKGAYVSEGRIIGRQKCDDKITIEAAVKNNGNFPLTPDTVVRIIGVRTNNHRPDDPFLTESKIIATIPLAGLAPSQSRTISQQTTIDCDIDWTMSEIKIAVVRNNAVVSPVYSLALNVDPESRAMMHILYLLLGLQ